MAEKNSAFAKRDARYKITEGRIRRGTHDSHGNKIPAPKRKDRSEKME